MIVLVLPAKITLLRSHPICLYPTPRDRSLRKVSNSSPTPGRWYVFGQRRYRSLLPSPTFESPFSRSALHLYTKDVFEEINPKKSSWSPPVGQFSSLLSIFSSTKMSPWPIDHLNHTHPKKPSNLSLKDEFIYVVAMTLSSNPWTKVAPLLFGERTCKDKKLFVKSATLLFTPKWIPIPLLFPKKPC